MASLAPARSQPARALRLTPASRREYLSGRPELGQFLNTRAAPLPGSRRHTVQPEESRLPGKADGSPGARGPLRPRRGRPRGAQVSGVADANDPVAPGSPLGGILGRS